MGILGVLKEAWQMKRNMKRSREEILKIQEEKLYKLIEHVLKNSKFYREYYEKHGISLENYREIEYTDYPTIDKSIIKNYFDELICTEDFKLKDLEEFVSHKENWGRKYRDRYTVMTSSGSTGNPVIFVYDGSAWDTVKAFIPGRVDTAHRMKLSTRERIAFLIAAGGDFASYNLAKEAEGINYSTLILNVNESLEKIIEAVRGFNPTVLSGYSSSISRLAEEKLGGRLDISPEKIFCSANKLTPERRELIERAFGVSPLDFYAASEALGMASEIPQKKKLFLFEDYYKFEIVDEKLEEVAPGETGDLIVTSLYNYTMPLLRYRMEDRLKKSQVQDFNFTLIDEVVGRTLDDLTFEREDGSRDNISALQLVGMYFRGIKKVQFIQESKDTLRVKYIAEKNIDAEGEIFPKLVEVLAVRGLDSHVKVKFERVDEIEIDPITGKYRPVIPLKEG
ncbi:hypothetical protein PM10SUCC1_04830 [Propionigenium maris DSM 9537]|uniref:Phenylacetate-CoA ligase n=1 Tax=Propionigenium maris DSM 9537 TaxID=1123000 RepID=A0A9W6GGS4_9FUSO|nr:hypothetical protein [Propionigenium maris]GLI54968.1 hypothetical protein PM10SUCC1_04830 [Propionigenium maris DSM 9537]